MERAAELDGIDLGSGAMEAGGGRCGDRPQVTRSVIVADAVRPRRQCSTRLHQRLHKEFPLPRDLPEALLAELNRWERKVALTPLQLPDEAVCPSDVLRAHFLMVEYFNSHAGEPVAFVGPKSVELLLSAIGRQHVEFGGVSKWSTGTDVVATLFFGLVKNHAFHDGNKRTALLVALFHLLRLRRVPKVPQDEFELLTVRTAASELGDYPGFATFAPTDDPEVRFLSWWFYNSTRRTNATNSRVTYRQLKGILIRFGFDLVNPVGNTIDVYRTDEHGVTVERVTNISFPGFTRQVAPGDLKRIRRVTGLTPERGYDADAFFRSADPLPALIDEFREPLFRLADA